MADNYSSFVSSVSDPARSAGAVTPNDSTDLTNLPKAIYVGTGGSLVVRLADDSTNVTLSNVADGSLLPLRVKRVIATGTTASGIVAFY